MRNVENWPSGARVSISSVHSPLLIVRKVHRPSSSDGQERDDNRDNQRGDGDREERRRSTSSQPSRQSVSDDVQPQSTTVAAVTATAPATPAMEADDAEAERAFLGGLDRCVPHL